MVFGTMGSGKTSFYRYMAKKTVEHYGKENVNAITSTNLDDLIGNIDGKPVQLLCLDDAGLETQSAAEELVAKFTNIRHVFEQKRKNGVIIVLFAVQDYFLLAKKLRSTLHVEIFKHAPTNKHDVGTIGSFIGTLAMKLLLKISKEVFEEHNYEWLSTCIAKTISGRVGIFDYDFIPSKESKLRVIETKKELHKEGNSPTRPNYVEEESLDLEALLRKFMEEKGNKYNICQSMDDLFNWLFNDLSLQKIANLRKATKPSVHGNKEKAIDKMLVNHNLHGNIGFIWEKAVICEIWSQLEKTERICFVVNRKTGLIDSISRKLIDRKYYDQKDSKFYITEINDTNFKLENLEGIHYGNILPYLSFGVLWDGNSSEQDLIFINKTKNVLACDCKISLQDKDQTVEGTKLDVLSTFEGEKVVLFWNKNVRTRWRTYPENKTITMTKRDRGKVGDLIAYARSIEL